MERDGALWPDLRRGGHGAAAIRLTGSEPARGLWTSLGRLPLRVFSVGKYAFQKKDLLALLPFRVGHWQFRVSVALMGGPGPGPCQCQRAGRPAARGTSTCVPVAHARDGSVGVR